MPINHVEQGLSGHLGHDFWYFSIMLFRQSSYTAMFMLSALVHGQPSSKDHHDKAHLEKHTGNLTRRQGICFSCVYSPDITLTGPEDNNAHRDETLFDNMNDWVLTFQNHYIQPHLRSAGPLLGYRRDFPLAHETLGGPRGTFVHTMSHETSHGHPGPSYWQSYLSTSTTQMDLAVHFWRVGHPGQYPSRIYITWHLETVSWQNKTILLRHLNH